MSLSNLLKFLGLLIVTVVMVVSFQVSNMTLEFGGLAVGAAVFLVGVAWEQRRAQ